ncbi:MAG: UvrD-helicase domain-containing protein [Melioribacter sp.]|nr:UvrD-helicase domain-containing protein [Melioribacter sp.]
MMLTRYQKDALNYNSNIFLSANAGSGKTFVLSKRFVNILVENDIGLENIVAITFTDKAAGELNKKIAIEIDERIENETDEKIKSKLENIRRQLVSANISTIHSFCVSILREFAPEAGIDANFIPIDQITADEILELAVDESINNLINDKKYNEKLKYLIRFFGSKRVVENHIKDAISSRKIINQHLITLYDQSEDNLANYFSKEFERVFVLLLGENLEKAIESINKINSWVLKHENENQIALEVLHWLTNFSKCNSLREKIICLKNIYSLIITSAKKIKSRDYLTSDRVLFENEISFLEKFYSDIVNFFDIEYESELHFELAKFGKNFIDIYKYVHNSYTDKKNQRGYLDFEDILLYTQKIIHNDDVLFYLRNKYKYIMIDEYQDTNELQYQIFMPILDDLKRGNLFVVGDDKQSIYMFRDAELEIFNRTKEEVEKSYPQGELLSLPHSFRLAPNIVLFTNKVFSKLFSEPNDIFNEVEYSELICARPEQENGEVELLLADLDKSITEAELVADKIIEITSDENKKVELKDIAILCRKRSNFLELEKEFIKKKIPYTIVGGKGFYQRQIVYDVYNYLSFLINTSDDAALIGILRAPFFVVSDDELFDISLEKGQTFYEKLIIKSKEDEKYKKIVSLLEEHRKISASSDAYYLIRKILLDTNYWAVISSKRNAEQELANLNKLISLSRSFTKKSFKNLYDFVFTLKNSIQTIEEEGQAQIVKDKDAVNLLTIHQAKGLEFKAVFLYGCNSYTKEEIVKTKNISFDKSFGILVKVPLNEDYFKPLKTPPIAALYNLIYRKKNIAEIKRLLYVAITRAMNYLYISLTHKEYKPNTNSFFHFITQALNPNYLEDEILLKDKIKFMKQSENDYEFYEKEIELKIPLVKELKKLESHYNFENKDKDLKKEFLIHQIKDKPKKEIFSATKISMFNQCPIKYELTYELGYTTIFDVFKKYQSQYEFNIKEDEEIKLFSDLRGRVIHSVLREDPKIENIIPLVDKALIDENVKGLEIENKIRKDIIEELIRFCSSDFYKQLCKYSEYKNEYEVYCEEGEHYLFGIIDKLIIQKNLLTIIDYKTDIIKESNIEQRAKEYFIQLEFYAYVLSKYFYDINDFELKIVFTSYPNNVITKFVKKDDLNEFGFKLNDYINKIIEKIFAPNYEHCINCLFFMDKSLCIKEYSQKYLL